VGVFQNHLMAAAVAKAAESTDFYTYQIANSCRFDGSSSVLTKTWGADATSDDKFAISVWVKGHKVDGTWQIIASAAQADLIFLGVGARYDSDAHAIVYTVDNGGDGAGSLARGRDVSAWRHIVMIYDSTESAGADRIKIYNNGEHWTGGSTDYWEIHDGDGLPPLNEDAGWGKNGNANEIGRYQYDGSADYSGYMADFVSIDGNASISDFGETKNGVWIPSDPSGLTFGNNGFWLNFASSGDLGNDVSGNNNDWSVAGLSAHDQMLDSPTFDSSSNGGNFCTFNTLNRGAYVLLSEGDLKTTGSGPDAGRVTGTIAPTSGKWYWECTLISISEWIPSTGIRDINGGTVTNPSNEGPYDSIRFLPAPPGGVYIDTVAANIVNMGTVTVDQTGISDYSNGDFMGIALDLDNRKIWYSKNGTWWNSGDPAAGSDPQASWSANNNIMMAPWSGQYGGSNSIFNFGQDGTFAGTQTAQGNADDTGYGNFYYDVPDGFLALCAGNLTTPAADPAEDDGPGKHFNAVTYTGSGSSQGITGVGFQPDTVLIKNRGVTDAWNHQNAVLGVAKTQEWNSDAAVADETDCIDSFDSDGFTVDSDHKVNADTETYVAYCWKESADAGFDIYTYSGTGSQVTVSHDLGVAPDLILNFLNTGSAWDSTGYFNTPAMGTGKGLFMTRTNAPQATTYVDSTSTSNFLTTNMSSSGRTYFGYTIANKEGLVQVGQYEGNGNADGAFVYCGFRPAFIMTKSADSTSDWQIFDDQRIGYNVDNNELQGNTTDAEATTDMIDILSNGFKMRIATDPNVAETYVFLAMAHNPFKYAVAR